MPYSTAAEIYSDEYPAPSAAAVSGILLRLRAVSAIYDYFRKLACVACSTFVNRSEIRGSPRKTLVAAGMIFIETAAKTLEFSAPIRQTCLV